MFNGDVNPENACQFCNTSNSAWNWSIIKTGNPCGVWKCSNDNETYVNPISGKYAVYGMCLEDSDGLINCTGVSDFFCADGNLNDVGSGTQIISCNAECDSIYDGNSTTICQCDESIGEKCISPCVFRPRCQGIKILENIYYCGETDFVCPEHYQDPSEEKTPVCSGEGILPECCDPDCGSCP